MAFWGFFRFKEEEEVIAWLKESGNEKTQWHGMATDIDKSFYEGGAKVMLDAMDHFSPETKDLTDAIRNDPKLLKSFDALVRDEGKEVLSELDALIKKDDGSFDTKEFAGMLKDPVKRDLVAQIFDAGAKSDHSMTDVIDFTKDTLSVADNPTDAAAVKSWKEKAAKMGIDTTQVENQAATGAIFGQINDFLKDPTKALFDMGMSADLIAMIEPLLKFFTGAADYYMNGDPSVGQPGLISIVQNGLEGKDARAAQINAGDFDGDGVKDAPKGNTEYASVGGTQVSSQISLTGDYNVATGAEVKEEAGNAPAPAAQQYNQTFKTNGLGMGSGN